MLVNMEKISLKNSSIKEDAIQSFIFKDPKVLGLGDVHSVQRERKQFAGGRLDILLASEDKGTRYEVEIQLGPTDPSHIIRTIEYWDRERKLFPHYDHCAVIIAEEITGRFMNVISLFNGSIPIIAIQVSAYKNGENISLAFTKILDRTPLTWDDEEESEPTDRNYWEKRSTSSMMKNVDRIFKELGDAVNGYDLKYNKFYIGMAKNGIVKNFITFKPKKSFLYLNIKGEENVKIKNLLEEAGLDVSYSSGWKEYNIKIAKIEEFINNKDLIMELINSSLNYFNINE